MMILVPPRCSDFYTTLRKPPEYMKRVLHALIECIHAVGGAHAHPLPGWKGQQVPIIIAPTDIPETLSDFPVLMDLPGSPWKTGGMTDIFSKAGNNTQKIAGTTSDGITQCCIEIESWGALARGRTVMIP